MRLLYWSMMGTVALLMVVMSFKVFKMTFGIKPVLLDEILDLQIEKSNLAIMAVIATALFLLATMLAVMNEF